MPPEVAQPSGSTPMPSRPMQLVGERVLPDPPQPMSLSETISRSMTPSPTTAPPSLSQEFVHRSAWKAGVMGAFNVLVAVLAVRLVLLVAVGGAIGLTVLALEQPDPYRLYVLAVYCGAVVLPATVLACVR